LNNFNKEQRQEAKTALQEHQKIYAYFHGSAKKGRFPYLIKERKNTG
jgi:hypothetical protein